MARRVAIHLWLAVASILTATQMAAGHPAHEAAPYRWVKSPPGSSGGTASTREVRSTLDLTPQGSLPRAVSTVDGQLFALFPQDAFTPESPVDVVVRTLAADSIASPPDGMAFDSNAYEVVAVTPSGDASPQTAVRVSVRYARAGRDLVVLDGGAWRVLPSVRSDESLHLTADVETLGTFAVVTESGGDTAARSWRRVGVPVAVGLSLVVAVAVTLLRRRRPRS